MIYFNLKKDFSQIKLNILMINYLQDKLLYFSNQLINIFIILITLE